MKTWLIFVGIIITGILIGELMLRACIHPFPSNQEPAVCAEKRGLK